MKILVTGGAGYIGSHTVKELQKAGHEVIVFDNLIYGHREAITCPLVVGDLLNKEDIEQVFAGNKFDGVIHFAGLAQVNESMREPSKYLKSYIIGGLNLLDAMKAYTVDKIIFSSSAGVYGYPKSIPITEDEEKKPVSVYGEAKLMFEKVLEWYDQLFSIKSIRLRYFNASGAALDGSIGEDHNPESHLIPIIMQYALGQREKLYIYGSDYTTKDGTCVRDYIHVLDLASAHIKALDYLSTNQASNYFNVGSGEAFSVLEVVNKVREVVGKNFTFEYAERRAGDPGVLCADNAKIKKILGWEPKYSDLDTIISSAWQWHKNHPKGYEQDNHK